MHISSILFLRADVLRDISKSGPKSNIISVFVPVMSANLCKLSENTHAASSVNIRPPVKL